MLCLLVKLNRVTSSSQYKRYNSFLKGRIINITLSFYTLTFVNYGDWRVNEYILNGFYHILYTQIPIVHRPFSDRSVCLNRSPVLSLSRISVGRPPPQPNHSKYDANELLCDSVGLTEIYSVCFDSFIIYPGSQLRPCTISLHHVFGVRNVPNSISIQQMMVKSCIKYTIYS